MQVSMQDEVNELAKKYATYSGNHGSTRTENAFKAGFTSGHAAGWEKGIKAMKEIMEHRDSIHCMCGSRMENHESPISCGHSPVSELEHSINLLLKESQDG